jgi:RNA recognition motif-containing protein
MEVLVSKLYVGNLPFQTSEDELKTFFEKFGPVASVRIIQDRDTGRSRGFGFVEMANSDSALSANGTSINGRSITVTPARERENSPRR